MIEALIMQAKTGKTQGELIRSSQEKMSYMMPPVECLNRSTDAVGIDHLRDALVACDHEHDGRRHFICSAQR